MKQRVMRTNVPSREAGPITAQGQKATIVCLDKHKSKLASDCSQYKTNLVQAHVHQAQEGWFAYRQGSPDRAEDGNKVMAEEATEDGVEIVRRHFAVDIVPVAVRVVPLPKPRLQKDATSICAMFPQYPTVAPY